MKITLIGFMGCGKTTIGKTLSKNLNLPFFDLDEIIVKKTGMSITEIFKKKGEEEFRKLESFILKELLHREKDLVLATGGGTPAYLNNIYEINKNSMSFFLKTDFKIIWDRIKSDKNRPLVSLGKEKLFKLYLKRFPFYLRADFTINTSFPSPIDTALQIEKRVKLTNAAEF